MSRLVRGAACQTRSDSGSLPAFLQPHPFQVQGLKRREVASPGDEHPGLMKSHLSLQQVGLLAKPPDPGASLKTTHFQRHGGEARVCVSDIR